MGQLFNRIFRIAKSYIDDTGVRSNYPENEDEELKRIIEELENDKASEKENKNNEAPNTNEFGLNEAFRVLGINNSSSWEDVKAAYKQKMKEYHPDRVMNLGDELKELASRKTKDINKSYEILKKHYNKSGKL